MGRDIFTQMTSVFDDLPKSSYKQSDHPMKMVNIDGDTTIIHIADPGEEMKKNLAMRNLVALKVRVNNLDS